MAIMIEGGSLVQNAVQAVRAHIRDNDLKAGDTLPGESHFAGTLGVSRAVMREAFGALAALRQIDVANGRRARVAAIDGSVMAASLDHAVSTSQISFAEVWDVRRTVELRIAELAAIRRTPAQAYN
ncbi:MAG: FadR family transcriptional regulator, partial [Sphingomonadales bacterium]